MSETFAGINEEPIVLEKPVDAFSNQEETVEEATPVEFFDKVRSENAFSTETAQNPFASDGVSKGQEAIEKKTESFFGVSRDERSDEEKQRSAAVVTSLQLPAPSKKKNNRFGGFFKH